MSPFSFSQRVIPQASLKENERSMSSDNKNKESIEQRSEYWTC